MRRIVIGKHAGGRTAFLDMSGRFKPKVWGGLFRMGDRAAAHLWVGDWRKRHPNDHIIIIDDPFKDGAADALHLDAVWLFDGIADEIWLTERKDEYIAKPNAYPLYHTNLWRIWLWLRDHKIFVPTIKPKPENLERVRYLLEQYKAPKKFVTFHPLFDAKYNISRNAPISWWYEVADKLTKTTPTVLIGSYQVAQQFKPLAGAYPLWDEKLSPMDSLALIYTASAHIGGETGLSLWASMFNVPTVAVYSYWHPTSGHFPMDCRPIPFKAPVEHALLGGRPEAVIEALRKVACSS